MRTAKFRILHGSWVAMVVCSLATLALPSHSAALGPNVRGRVTGQEKLSVDVYVEAAKPDAKRWWWREPSPAVAAPFRNLTPNISREVCIVATNNGQNPAAAAPLLVRVTGGRTNPAMIVVTPESQIQFRNDDPFPHRLYAVGQDGWNGSMDARAVREWKAPAGKQRIEFRDERSPSLRTYVLVEPQAVQTVYPSKDNAFGFALPGGDYVIKAFFCGKQVGKSFGLALKERGVTEMKEPMNLSEAADAK
jgi:hypothetical protein